MLAELQEVAVLYCASSSSFIGMLLAAQSTITAQSNLLYMILMS